MALHGGAWGRSPPPDLFQSESEHKTSGRMRMDFLQYILFENELQTWGIALLVTAALYLFLLLVQALMRNKVAQHTARTRNEWDDFLVGLVQEIWAPFLLLLAVYVGSLLLTLSEGATAALWLLVKTALLVQLGIWLVSLTNFMIARRVKRHSVEDATATTNLSVLSVMLKVAVWAVVILLVLDNLPGIQITSLIASLGIAGVAVGLAVQNILGDLFASLSIALDKPFVIGDFINVGDFSGTVEKIGLKSTRVRSLSGEQLVFGNNDLLSSRIRNYKRMNRRRVPFNLGVTYQTKYDQLKLIPEIVREVIEPHEKVTFDRAHFKEYGGSALIFEIVYYVEESDYNLFMDIQQSINLELYKRFEHEGIDFAYPTQTVFIEHNREEMGEKISG
jgi:small-conductance mechanosensitive channel